MRCREGGLNPCRQAKLGYVQAFMRQDHEPSEIAMTPEPGPVLAESRRTSLLDNTGAAGVHLCIVTWIQCTFARFVAPSGVQHEPP